jgi:hypothetical protein
MSSQTIRRVIHNAARLFAAGTLVTIERDRFKNNPVYCGHPRQILSVS